MTRQDYGHDDEDAALAHQQELENRAAQERDQPVVDLMNAVDLVCAAVTKAGYPMMAVAVRTVLDMKEPEPVARPAKNTDPF